MAEMPIDTRLKVEQIIEDGLIVQKPRPYLGMSTLADCARKQWYGFRFCSELQISPRLNRLFGRGHNEEPIIQNDLRKAGIICLVDPNNQPEFVDGNGHMKGHPDDKLLNIPDAPKTPHLGEYKTHNDKSFKHMNKNGLRKSKPIHYGQMQVYMRKWELTRGLYIAVNKNDDSRYYERVVLDKAYADILLNKGRDIISSEIPPQRMNNNPDYYECKWCLHYEICHHGKLPLKNCRTCHYCDICDEGKWECSGHKIELSFQQQQIGCKRHKYMRCF